MKDSLSPMSSLESKYALPVTSKPQPTYGPNFRGPNFYRPHAPIILPRAVVKINIDAAEDTVPPDMGASILVEQQNLALELEGSIERCDKFGERLFSSIADSPTITRYLRKTRLYSCGRKLWTGLASVTVTQEEQLYQPLLKISCRSSTALRPRNPPQ
ncbi:hypothetical protein FA15DRAFT_669499, partial [Coprinopsis marcescibilis]